MALYRLRQTLQHLLPQNATPQPSFFQGPTEPVLLSLSMGQLLEEQARKFPRRDAIVIPWSNIRYTFHSLNERSKEVARGLIAMGVESEDRIGIFSGNCERYIELFFAVCRIGAIFVVLNPAYTPRECENALRHAGCKMLFTAMDVGRKNQLPLLTRLVDVAEQGSPSLPNLKRIIIIRGENPFPSTFTTYEDLLGEATLPHTFKIVDDLTTSLDPHSVCNFQFTSGTTGAPKATTLTVVLILVLVLLLMLMLMLMLHHNIINNGLLIGHVMRLRPNDIICCPPPLYHAFGLVLGLLACYTHGVTIIFPSWDFNPELVLNAIVSESCTGLLGVPTMLVAVLQTYRTAPENRWPSICLRTGIAAGSPVPRHLMSQLQATFGLPELVIIYGMTEVSGASFITSPSDGLEEKLSTVGRVIPHTSAKVISPSGEIVPVGTRGELCMAGFGVQSGYYLNPEKTEELMQRDKEGIVWVHSGDEATIDSRGYARITGRIKDMIIRGGENIYPFEIEQRLGEHEAVVQSSVVGLRDERYGEVVAAFLEGREGVRRPGVGELQEFVRGTLGRYNAPVHVFWVGKGEDVQEYPKTSSGKIQKVQLREIGNKLIGNE